MKEHMSPQIFSQINPHNFLFLFCGHLFFLSARTLYEVQRISFKEFLFRSFIVSQDEHCTFFWKLFSQAKKHQEGQDRKGHQRKKFGPTFVWCVARTYSERSDFGKVVELWGFPFLLSAIIKKYICEVWDLRIEYNSELYVDHRILKPYSPGPHSRCATQTQSWERVTLKQWEDKIIHLHRVFCLHTIQLAQVGRNFCWKQLWLLWWKSRWVCSMDQINLGLAYYIHCCLKVLHTQAKSKPWLDLQPRKLDTPPRSNQQIPRQQLS